MTILNKIFGLDDTAGKVVDGVIDGIDALVYTDEEEAQDKLKFLTQKTDATLKLIKAKAEAKESYHPYKITQRVIALSFTFIYLFLILNGIMAILWGFGNIENVKEAVKFANSMWLGEITLAIISFYFGDSVYKKYTDYKEKQVGKVEGK